MIKDPLEVRRLALQKEEENHRFRSLTKMLSPKRRAQLNKLAERFGLEAQAQMDCTTCGACCRDNWVPVNDEEADRLAVALSLPVLDVRQKYLTVDEDREVGIDAKPCPFLDGNRCSVYAHRPDVCRGYPYVGGDISTRMWGIIERAETCPIIYDMLERTKAAMGFHRLAP